MINAKLINEMEAAGLVPAEALSVMQDGEIQRYQVAGDKRGSKNGWLVSYYNIDAPAVHVFGSWKCGSSITFIEDGSTQITVEARDLIQQAQRQAKLKKEREQLAVAQQCAEIWDSLQLAEFHPYLTTKNIHPHIARCWDESLVIPLVDFNMSITSLQFINPNGGKTFRKGGKTRGSFCLIGAECITDNHTWVICEGFATGASIYEATGLPVLVAFNANNLTPVVAALRLAAPSSKIIIAADNDRFTKVGNVGVKEAEKAAQAAGAYVVIPQFNSSEGTDFNDLAEQCGLSVVTSIFQEVAA